MSILKDLRTFFGISQADLASYFRITRTLLSMCEIEERELPPAAAIKMAKLVIAMNTQGGFEEKEKETQPILSLPSGSPKLLEEAEQCDWMARKMRRQLAAVQQRYAQATHALALVAHLAANTPAEEENKKDRLWLEIIKGDAEKDLEKFSEAVQAHLQWKIEWYEWGAGRAREIGGVWPKN